jgi:FtsZ-binding cell division protein ZapB
MESDLDELERKVAALIAYAQALREANETLTRALGDARERERAFAQRMEVARGRLDALLEQLPH